MQLLLLLLLYTFEKFCFSLSMLLLLPLLAADSSLLSEWPRHRHFEEIQTSAVALRPPGEAIHRGGQGTNAK